MEQELIVSKETRKLLDKETAEFYLNMAEKKLVSTIEISNRITERGYLLASLLVALLTGISWALSKDLTQVLTICSLIGITVCCTCLTLIVFKIICVHKIWTIGRSPTDLKINEFINYYHKTGNNALVNVIADELNPIEEKIALNIRNSEKKAKSLAWCLKLIIAGIITVALILAVYYSLQLLPSSLPSLDSPESVTMIGLSTSSSDIV